MHNSLGSFLLKGGILTNELVIKVCSNLGIDFELSSFKTENGNLFIKQLYISNTPLAVTVP